MTASCAGPRSQHLRQGHADATSLPLAKAGTAAWLVAGAAEAAADAARAQPKLSLLLLGGRGEELPGKRLLGCRVESHDRGNGGKENDERCLHLE